MRTVPAATNVRAAISEVELRELYITQELTIEEIARKFGLAATTVSRRLMDLGIGARPRGPVSKTRSAREGIEWNADLAYTVGLIATDGCLSGDGRHLSIVSKDIDLLQTVQRSLHLTAGGRYHADDERIWQTLPSTTVGGPHSIPVVARHGTHARKKSQARRHCGPR